MSITTNQLVLSEVNRAILSRRSVRAFLPKPVSRNEIDEILEFAARAPSGSNIQPWHVHVLTGDARQVLCDTVSAAYERGDITQRAEYDYYPHEFFEPYLSRRRKNGWSLYGLLGIARDEKMKMKVQLGKNFQFFGAPVGLIFTIDRRLAQGSWLDYGMFLQTLMLAAVARGLATCPQAAWIDYHRIIGKQLGFAEHEQLVCGMALGYEDHEAIESTFHTERASLSDFVVHHDKV